MRRLKTRLMKNIYAMAWTILRKKEMTSKLLRTLRFKIYKVDVGMYSYGCFDPLRFGNGATIGRYCSFAPTCYRFNGNHGTSFLSLHPYFYNTRLGLVEKESIVRTQIIIEDDVWVGHNAIILPAVNLIGRGSVIAAGAVVTKNVPRYAVVGGNPAKVIKYRFTDEVISNIESLEWWNMSKSDIAKLINENSSLCFQPAELYAMEIKK